MKLNIQHSTADVGRINRWGCSIAARMKQHGLSIVEQQDVVIMIARQPSQC